MELISLSQYIHSVNTYIYFLGLLKMHLQKVEK